MDEGEREKCEIKIDDVITMQWLKELSSDLNACVRRFYFGGEFMDSNFEKLNRQLRDKLIGKSPLLCMINWLPLKLK